MHSKKISNILLRLGMLLLLFLLVLVTACTDEEQPQQQPNTQPNAGTILKAEDFITMYPGVPFEKEKDLVDAWIAENNAINERGTIDIQALISGNLPKDTPGVSTVINATEEMIRYENGKYDPENPLLNDADYARKAGFENIFALPPFAAHDDSYMVPYPKAARDTFLVEDLNHSVTYYKPIYPGDTLYLIVDSRHFLDITPAEGAMCRSVALEFKGSIYNQKGEKVNDVIYRVVENLFNFKDSSNPGNYPQRIVPEWLSRPAHYYTDEDWETIKGIWANEKRQGAVPLYWEDVNIGDRPAWTLDGPIDLSYGSRGGGGFGTIQTGMSSGGARTLKKEIMDPEIFKTMVRDEKTGIYQLPDKADYFPVVPSAPGASSGIQGGAAPSGGFPGGDRQGAPGGAQGAQGAPGAPETQEGAAVALADDTKGSMKQADNRSTFMNTQGRELALRHISNWMGENGWFYNISWSMMSADNLADFGYIVPENPQAVRWLEKVPEMKGKHVNAHGVTTDVAIVKSYVYNKYVRDNEFFVDLAWWIESIDGYIWMEGGATVKLPSKRAK